MPRLTDTWNVSRKYVLSSCSGEFAVIVLFCNHLWVIEVVEPLRMMRLVMKEACGAGKGGRKNNVGFTDNSTPEKPLSKLQITLSQESFLSHRLWVGTYSRLVPKVFPCRRNQYVNFPLTCVACFSFSASRMLVVMALKPFGLPNPVIFLTCLKAEFVPASSASSTSLRPNTATLGNMVGGGHVARKVNRSMPSPRSLCLVVASLLLHNIRALLRVID